MTIETVTDVHEQVRARYGRIAEDFRPALQASCCDDGACCSDSELYDSDTSWLPGAVTGLSLGCGDPITLAELKEGEVVLDLGSGGGIDCFMAARAVGPTGHVIGLDMTVEMIAKAEINKEKVALDNVEFRLGHIEQMPVDDDTVDVIISNCVINLSPDKEAVFRESFRVLKPGGKLAVSDMVTQGHFTAAERADMRAWSACITGAEDVSDYVAAIEKAGFESISVRDKGNPEVELAHSLSLGGPARLFSGVVTAVKPQES